MATAELMVDTEVLIDHVRGEQRAAPRREDQRLRVSVLTRGELFAGRDQPAVLHGLLRAMIELPIDSAIAELAGVTRRQTGLATPDALITATADTSHPIDDPSPPPLSAGARAPGPGAHLKRADARAPSAA